MTASEIATFPTPSFGEIDPAYDNPILPEPKVLGPSEKAAIIVRLLMTKGEDVPIDALPENLQAKLTAQMGDMGLIDKVTLDSVVTEFTDALEGLGLSFPRGLARALETLDGKLSPQTSARLRKEAGVREAGDPWLRLRALPVSELAAIVQAESTEVAAVLLSKLETKQAAELLTVLPGPLARRLTYAVSLTGKITPDSVDRIGLSLASQIAARPDKAFDTGPEKRIGAILNQSSAATRDDMLSALEETDKDLAEEVRKSIFIFENIDERVHAADIPTIVRDIDQQVLVTALAAADSEEDKSVVEFILSNLSTRMADGLREEIRDRGKIRKKDGEAAMTEVVSTIRTLEDLGTITYREPIEDEDENA